jgi:hypothetical protein
MIRSVILPSLLVFALALTGCSQQATEPVAPEQQAEQDSQLEMLSCPDATMTAVCDNSSSLTHVKNEHCAGLPGKSEWGTAYCTNNAALIEACKESTVNPASADHLNCFARGEEGEIVGTDSAGNDTNCYKVVFGADGFGKVKMITMFPVANGDC